MRRRIDALEEYAESDGWVIYYEKPCYACWYKAGCTQVPCPYPKIKRAYKKEKGEY
jgi:hypothetical protein